MNYHSSENQRILEKFVDREVIYCVSHLVYELAQKAEHFPKYEDDLFGAFEGLPDYQAAAEDNGCVLMDNEGVNMFYNEDQDEWFDSDDWQELCDQEGIDVDDYIPEIFEHWIITDFLANRLEAKGERVLRDFFGMTVWCRSCTGQSILLDMVIGAIAHDMEILSGQRNEWKI